MREGAYLVIFVEGNVGNGICEGDTILRCQWTLMSAYIIVS